MDFANEGRMSLDALTKSKQVGKPFVLVAPSIYTVMCSFLSKSSSGHRIAPISGPARPERPAALLWSGHPPASFRLEGVAYLSHEDIANELARPYCLPSSACAGSAQIVKPCLADRRVKFLRPGVIDQVRRSWPAARAWPFAARTFMHSLADGASRNTEVSSQCVEEPSARKQFTTPLRTIRSVMPISIPTSCKQVQINLSIVRIGCDASMNSE